MRARLAVEDARILAVRQDDGRTEAMVWCDANGVDYIFGLVGNAALHNLSYQAGDDLKVRRAEAGVDRMRGSTAPAWLRLLTTQPMTAPGFPSREGRVAVSGRPTEVASRPRAYCCGVGRLLSIGSDSGRALPPTGLNLLIKPQSLSLYFHIFLPKGCIKRKYGVYEPIFS